MNKKSGMQFLAATLRGDPDGLPFLFYQKIAGGLLKTIFVVW
jgi:hypothetical protein